MLEVSSSVTGPKFASYTTEAIHEDFGCFVDSWRYCGSRIQNRTDSIIDRIQLFHESAIQLRQLLQLR